MHETKDDMSDVGGRFGGRAADTQSKPRTKHTREKRIKGAERPFMTTEFGGITFLMFTQVGSTPYQGRNRSEGHGPLYHYSACKETGTDMWRVHVIMACPLMEVPMKRLGGRPVGYAATAAL